MRIGFIILVYKNLQIRTWHTQNLAQEICLPLNVNEKKKNFLSLLVCKIDH